MSLHAAARQVSRYPAPAANHMRHILQHILRRGHYSQNLAVSSSPCCLSCPCYCCRCRCRRLTTHHHTTPQRHTPVELLTSSCTTSSASGIACHGTSSASMLTDTCPSALALPSVEFFAMLTMDFLSNAVLVLAKPLEPLARPLECLSHAKRHSQQRVRCVCSGCCLQCCW